MDITPDKATLDGTICEESSENMREAPTFINTNNNNFSAIDIQESENTNETNGQSDYGVHQDLFASNGCNSMSVPSASDQFPAKLVISSEVTRSSLSQGAQQIIDDLNAKRKQDTQLLSNIKKALEFQTEKVYKSTEEHLFKVYETQGKVVQDKLCELFAIIDNISKLEAELKEFKQALQILYRDMKD